MEPLEYLRIFGRRWRILVAVIAIGVVAAFVTTPKPKPHLAGVPTSTAYRATETLLVDLGALAQQGESLARATFLVTVGDVPKRAAAALHYKGDPLVLARQITTTSDPNIGTIEISATGSDGAAAAQLASAFGKALISDFSDQALASYNSAVTSTTTQLNDMQNKIRVLDQQIAHNDDPLLSAQRNALGNQYQLLVARYQSLANQAPPTNPFTVVQAATPIPVIQGGITRGFKAPTGRVGRMLIAALIGLLLGGVLCLGLERVDIHVRSKEGAEEAFGLPVIAEVPVLPRRRRHLTEIVTVTQPASPYAESYRILRTSILFLRQETLRQLSSARSSQQSNGNGNGNGNGSEAAHHPVMPSLENSQLHAIMITSPGPGEGKTTSVANLAAAFAEAGQSVLVLSCDLRRPRIEEMLRVEDGPGLSDVLSGRPDAPTLAEVARSTKLRGVWLVTSGADIANPAELLAAERVVIAEARGLVDIVIIDTPPVLAANDASELAPAVDVVVVVARAAKTTREASQRTTEVLARLGAPVLGVALVGAPQVPTARRYYYRYRVAHNGLFGWRKLLRPTKQGPVEGQRAETMAPTRASNAPGVADSGERKGNGWTATGAPSIPPPTQATRPAGAGTPRSADPPRWRHRARGQPAFVLEEVGEEPEE